MNSTAQRTNYILLFLALALIALVLFLPLDVLEYLSLEVVGEPPINGLSWMEGVDAVGGSLSMRVLAIFGMIIIFSLIPVILKWQKKSIEKRTIKNYELLFFLSATLVFFVVNFLIGYDWWDPDAVLGLGPLFIPSIVSLIILGFLPEIAHRLFKFDRSSFAESTQNLKKISLIMIIAAFGYGLISLIWHCCSFFDVKIYFFYFVIKLIQLWAMCSFFFKWGFPLFLNITHEWKAYLIISVLFGFCYPWHTFGFAITFSIFGFLICILTRKTNSFLTGMILLYFSYLFHTGLAWQGPLITFSLIYPIAVIALVFNIFLMRRMPLHPNQKIGNP
jgi:hypothetical protein